MQFFLDQDPAGALYSCIRDDGTTAWTNKIAGANDQAIFAQLNQAYDALDRRVSPPVTVTAAQIAAAATAAIPVTEQNKQTLQQRAEAALASNQTFLSISNPTTAQALAQIQLLTRETTALVRLLLGLLDSTNGT